MFVFNLPSFLSCCHAFSLQSWLSGILQCSCPSLVKLAMSPVGFCGALSESKHPGKIPPTGYSTVPSTALKQQLDPLCAPGREFITVPYVVGGPGSNMRKTPPVLGLHVPGEASDVPCWGVIHWCAGTPCPWFLSAPSTCGSSWVEAR